jgi:hypothetical protein
MTTHQNVLELSLLRKDPASFIQECQFIIRKCIDAYRIKGMFAKTDEEDLTQSINEELIRRLPQIENQYNGKVLLNTYVSVIVQNICLKIHRDAAKVIETMPLDEASEFAYETNYDILIKDEIERLSAILELFHTQRKRLVVCLKVYCRLMFDEEEILNYFPDISEYDKNILMAAFCGPYDEMSVEEIFSIVTVILNKYEGKNNQWDSTRRWTQDRLNRIIMLLNGNPPRHTYTEESFKILLDNYFHKGDNF